MSASSAYIVRDVLELHHKILLRDSDACIWFWEDFHMTDKSWSFNSQDSVIYENERRMLLKQTVVYSAFLRKEKRREEKDSSLAHE